MHPHHDGIDGTDNGPAGVDHDLGCRLGQRLDDAGAGCHEHPIARLHELRDGHGRTHDVAASGDADRSQCLFVVSEGGRRIVGHEQHPASAGSQRGDRLDGTGNRLMSQPDHTVEIAQHGVDLLDPIVHRRDRCSRGPLP